MPDAERKGMITFKGNGLTLVGSEVKIGDKAPDFKVLAKDLSEVTLVSSKGKVRLISVVPSVDTPVCSLQTKKFNEEASKLPASVEILTVSMDLPFALARFCGAEHADKIKPLSDHREASFGKAYGVLIKELRLLTRAVFVIDQNDKVIYSQIVKEVTDHPDYEKAIAALKQVAK